MCRLFAERRAESSVRFPRPVAGPVAVGAGRYRGLGLFAADGDA